MSINLLLIHNHPKNLHFLNRYIKFISTRSGILVKNKTHLHHILPKAMDMFPQFSDLKKFQWNGIYLTPREHFIAHWILSKAFPGSSQTRAFYHMTNILITKKSRQYELARENHIQAVIKMTKNPERCKKISMSLSGKSKSKEHIASMRGHSVSEETREKLRNANLGKKYSDQVKMNMSKSRIGRSKAKNTLNSKLNIAASVCDYDLITPIGTFHSHLEASIAYKVTSRRMILIFQNLDVVPRQKVRYELGINDSGKTYSELGFKKIPKII